MFQTYIKSDEQVKTHYDNTIKLKLLQILLLYLVSRLLFVDLKAYLPASQIMKFLWTKLI